MRILVGTEAGLYEVGAAERSDFPGREITALVADGPRWWALVDGQRLWRAAEGRWEEVAALEGERGTCLLPADGGLLVGTAGAHVQRLEHGRLGRVETFDRTAGREAWHTPWGEPPDTRSLTRDATGALYVNVHVGGVVRSRDGGRTWQPTLDIETDVHQVLAHPTRPGLVLAAAAVGLAVSDDGGTRWRTDVEGLHARYARAVALGDDTLLLSVSSGPRGRRAALYRRSLEGAARFERCRDGLPEWFDANIDTACLAAQGQDAAFGTDDGRVFRSPDGGASWERVAKDLPPVHCVALG